jgi:predicted dehydrogenase
LGEHSHAINIWQHFAHVAGAGRVCEVSANLDIVKDDDLDYDRLALITLKTENGLLGDVIQDVITLPTEKSARLQGTEGALEWVVNYQPGVDAVLSYQIDGSKEEKAFPKTRADDFKAEIDHIHRILTGEILDSPIELGRGLDSLMVIAAAFKSNALGRRVNIDWAKGYAAEALV